MLILHAIERKKAAGLIGTIGYLTHIASDVLTFLYDWRNKFLKCINKIIYFNIGVRKLRNEYSSQYIIALKRYLIKI